VRLGGAYHDTGQREADWRRFTLTRIVLMEMGVTRENSSEAGQNEGPSNSTALHQTLENGGEDTLITEEERVPLNRADLMPEQEDIMNIPLDTKETFKKVVRVFARQPPDGCQKLLCGTTDRTDDAPVNDIVTEKMEKIIDQLFTNDTWVHSINNVIPVFGHSPEKKKRKHG
jgi:hypothetical protein